LDTKSKNRHNVSFILALVVVLTAAVTMVGLYPFFKREIVSYEEPVYQQQSFLRHLVFGNYVLALEEKEYEQGNSISPFNFYFPNAAEELKNNSLGYNNGHTDGTVGEVNPDSEADGLEMADPEAAGPEKVADAVDPDAVAGSADSAGPEAAGSDTLAGAADSATAGPDTADSANAEEYGFHYELSQSNLEAEAEYEERQSYLKSLRQSCVGEFENWKQYFNSIRSSIDYQVLNENGEVLIGHGGGRSILKDDSYVFKAVMHYDELGRMEVTDVIGDNTSFIINALQNFGEIDPMHDNYWDEYRYDQDIKLENPKNKTFVYGMNENQLATLTELKSTNWNSYRQSGIVLKVFAGLMCAVAVLAFLISCFDVRWAEDNKALRVPFEIVMGLWGIGFGFGITLNNLVANTNRGEVYSTLLRAGFLNGVANVLVKLWNVFWWSVPFALTYWMILCVRDIFHIGFRRYIRERTLLGLFWGWVKGICNKMYSFIVGINLQEKSDKTIFKIVGVNFIILAVLCSMWFFGIGVLFIYSVVLFTIMRKYYRDLSAKYRILLEATNQIAEGNLDVTVEEDLGMFDPFKTEVQKIQSGFKVAVGEEVKSQKLKTDLISNMSHDLKTPLTAIITYVNLLKDDNITNDQKKAYIDVLEKKSMRLKALIEDLFEISKANSNNVTLDLADVDIVSLMKEVSLELSDKMEESTIDFRWNLPDDKIVLPMDGQKTYRIFDNLLTNIMKYAMPYSRAYIDMKKDNSNVVITMKNVSAAELDFNPDDITERFVRGDQSRNTEGSGLGMAIAKSFVELQNGKFQVEVEADLFRVIITWPIPEK
jgi:hypothetical protein